MASYQYLNFLIFVSLRKTLIIIEMFKELRELSFFFPTNPVFEIGNSRLEWIATEFKSEFYMLFFI